MDNAAQQAGGELPTAERILIQIPVDLDQFIFLTRAVAVGQLACGLSSQNATPQEEALYCLEAAQLQNLIRDPEQLQHFNDLQAVMTRLAAATWPGLFITDVALAPFA